MHPLEPSPTCFKPIGRATLVAFVSIAFFAGGNATSAATPTGSPTMTLKHFNVTIRVYDPDGDRSDSHDYVLPVDSPDEEHAAASTLANAASFTQKTRQGAILPVAFRCIRIEPRP